MKTLCETFLRTSRKEAYHFLWCAKQTEDKFLMITLPLLKESLPQSSEMENVFLVALFGHLDPAVPERLHLGLLDT